MKIVLFDDVLWSGGIHVTVDGQNLDSVAEPIMVVVVAIDGETSTLYQVISFISPVFLDKIWQI